MPPNTNPDHYPAGWLVAGSTALAFLAFLFCAGCGLTTRQAETAALDAANAAIVSAAHDIDATEQAEEAACMVKAVPDVQPCITRARRWNDALAAYDVWRLAWSALRAVWNNPTAGDEEIAAAQAKVEKARASFWLATIAGEAGR